jgi:hypothetical protein
MSPDTAEKDNQFQRGGISLSTTSAPSVDYSSVATESPSYFTPDVYGDADHILIGTHVFGHFSRNKIL